MAEIPDYICPEVHKLRAALAGWERDLKEERARREKAEAACEAKDEALREVVSRQPPDHKSLQWSYGYYTAMQEVSQHYKAASASPALATSQEREWRFNRYRNGRLMAQGARVRAVSEEEARQKARRLFPESPGDTFVLDTNAPATNQERREPRT